ncbi:MAG TPA: hypothetical protein VG099_21300 [Gemmataceae bacterium]|nr:hypothetical protein [Gemmataceae bacterium]
MKAPIGACICPWSPSPQQEIFESVPKAHANSVLSGPAEVVPPTATWTNLPWGVDDLNCESLPQQMIASVADATAQAVAPPRLIVETPVLGGLASGPLPQHLT